MVRFRAHVNGLTYARRAFNKSACLCISRRKKWQWSLCLVASESKLPHLSLKPLNTRRFHITSGTYNFPEILQYAFTKSRPGRNPRQFRAVDFNILFFTGTLEFDLFPFLHQLCGIQFLLGETGVNYSKNNIFSRLQMGFLTDRNDFHAEVSPHISRK